MFSFIEFKALWLQLFTDINISARHLFSYIFETRHKIIVLFCEISSHNNANEVVKGTRYPEARRDRAPSVGPDAACSRRHLFYGILQC